jgi:hypothetical protein
VGSVAFDIVTTVWVANVTKMTYEVLRGSAALITVLQWRRGARM